MEFKKSYLIGIAISIIVIIAAHFFTNEKTFSLFVGIGIMIGVGQILLDIMHENKISAEKEEMFLEFARNLVESVKTGTPVSKSIINMGSKNYGALTPHVRKLANQISLGVPFTKALQTFSKDVKNASIARSLTLIGQAEKAGGDIGEILEAVAGAVNMADKLKKERKASVSTLVSQGYIIFFVFIVIILIMQFQIVPMVSGLGDVGGSLGFGGGGLNKANFQQGQKQIADSFLYLILVQGFFTGLVIGKLSEENIKAGIKHSVLLMFISFITSTVANIIFWS